MSDKFYKKYLLVLLSLILAFNQVDRLALGLVLQDIKVDLALTDTQLGLLSGIAFALFYSIMGIPIARWADRGNRVTIVSLTTMLWSGAVALCGAAGNFFQLLLIRIGVAVGEAGCVPPAHSFIADYFTRAERPRAVALYMLGGPLSAVVGYFIAGWLNEFYGWRATFIVLGLPGVMLAVLARFTLREPRTSRRAHSPEVSTPERIQPAPTLRDVMFTLWTDATFRHLLFSFSVLYFFAYGMAKWQPAFFVRSFGLQTGELGTWFSIIYGISGLLGTYWGGELASRYASNKEHVQLKAMAVACCAFGALLAGAYLSSSRYAAFGLIGLATLGGTMINGPLFATIQTLVPQQMRAVSVALILLFANLIGMGLGPLAAGALSDALRPMFGEESLRYVLLLLCPGQLWVGWHLWRASLTVRQSLQASALTSQSWGKQGESSIMDKSWKKHAV
ncbi:MFS transporter [Steroidobacter sp. S1-65]|uniref:MFS transporter n=1 Tax=Steroidobacter gossypii TaxID=2805490 RepID=A0ABS1WZZ6_9GAMM|nr:MFS transporter [Steroidobacter gossypii]MBM0106517.1 MFS transporter [Steroidobacter gossypii]